ncbi:unnamed protein product [Durusdinium trenchii]|uniref:Cyclic nucleotide-binding domain-containing protein n=1 Tax=Durusdinium trenchii TaxID=1381693 RepID=A0ABP0K168_9DINO
MRKIEQNQNEREKNKKKKTKDMSMKQRLDGSKDDKKESDESKPIKEKKNEHARANLRLRFANAFRACGAPWLFFRKQERECVRKICEFLEPRLYYPGMALMKEGEMGFEMFILHSGKVEVLKGSKVVAELGGGVVLGDVAVLGSDKRRSATVKCLECTLVYVLNGEVVQETLEKFPVTKTVYDHDYIARLLRFELEKAADEVEHLENFYGKCHPMKLDQVSSEIFGRNVDF